MSLFPIGVSLAALGLPVRESLRQAARLGADGVELAVSAGEMTPTALSQTGRREVRRLIERHALRLFSLDGRLPGAALGDPRRAEEAVERTILMLQLAADLRAPVVVTQVGLLSVGPEAESWRVASECLARLGDVADRHGVVLAAVTGPGAPADLVSLLDGVSAGGLGVAYHPAFLTRAGIDPTHGVADMASRLVHAYAADVTGAADGTWQAVPLGEGDVAWEAVLGVLAQVDYRGPLVVSGQGTSGTSADVQKAVGFLRGF